MRNKGAATRGRIFTTRSNMTSSALSESFLNCASQNNCSALRFFWDAYFPLISYTTKHVWIWQRWWREDFPNCNFHRTVLLLCCRLEKQSYGCGRSSLYWLCWGKALEPFCILANHNPLTGSWDQHGCKFTFCFGFLALWCWTLLAQLRRWC